MVLSEASWTMRAAMGRLIHLPFHGITFNPGQLALTAGGEIRGSPRRLLSYLGKFDAQLTGRVLARPDSTAPPHWPLFSHLHGGCAACHPLSGADLVRISVVD